MMPSHRSSVRFVVFLLGLIAATQRLQSDPPMFAPPVRQGDGAIDLTLSGDVGVNYRIDRSTNLVDWVLATSGVANNGLLTYRHSASADKAVFFRGRRIEDRLAPLTVTPVADTNFFATGLATPSAQSVVLHGNNFIQFTLKIPTNSAPDATVLNVSYVTNLTGLPFAGPLIGAVSIGPSNAIFWRGAELEITFPTNIDRRKIVSFACNADGSAFRLVPNRVYRDRVMIPIMRNGIFGSVIATTEELNAAARRDVYAAAAASLAGSKEKTAVASAAQECNPAAKARAESVRAQIQRALDQRRSDLAAFMGIERQRQLVGIDEDPSELFTEFAGAICQFYTTQVAPHWAEAANNCALAKVLLQFTMSLERQRQLLGATDDCIGFSNLPLCGMMENCLKEIQDCCDLGFKGRDKIVQVLSLQRQDQLLGLDCISNEEAQDVINRCSSNKWTGTFSMRGFGTYFFSTNRNGTLTIDSRELETSFEGAVVESEEFGTPEIGYQISLKAVGQLTVYDFESLSHDGQSLCLNGQYTSRYFLQENKTTGSENTVYNVTILTQPGGGYMIYAGNVDGANIGIAAVETLIDLSQVSDCDGGSRTENRVIREDERVLGYPLGIYQGQMTAPDNISGSTMTVDTSGHPLETEYRFNWDFSRQTVAPE